MGLPRSLYVQEGQEGVYHCFSRCVRRAFLYGFDALTRRDFSHRKSWLVDRLQHLAAIFAIDVCAYAIMENHYHTILRTRPDIVADWTDREVAIRWLTLFSRHCDMKGNPIPATEEEICALIDCRERITQLRKRLSSLSWFMGRLNEFIARAANKEDRVKGRFWESRFKCQALLDDAAIAACMVYVDLNPIRAGLAGTPEESNFTSIQERIRAWQKGMTATASMRSEAAQDMQYVSWGRDRLTLEIAGELSNTVPEPSDAALSTSWLCPIQSEIDRRGVLQMTRAEYFDLVDESGRIARLDKRGSVDAHLAPILLRIGANPDAWHETVTRFGSKFRLAAGLLTNLRSFAHQLNRHWLKGAAAARTAFMTSPPRLA
jgi:hypothetical protein